MHIPPKNTIIMPAVKKGLKIVFLLLSVIANVQ
jgi:hypothetical protein